MSDIRDGLKIGLGVALVFLCPFLSSGVWSF
jgi:hypothetical protein